VPLPDFEHPIPGESSRAFRAFLRYRDLGPLRSIDATAAIVAAPGKAKCRASGIYNRWSSKHSWVDRAAAFDCHIEDARMRAHLQRIQSLDRRRAEFEFKNQQLLEERVVKMDTILDKFDNAPIIDTTEETTETVAATETVRGSITRTRSKIKGINPSGYSALVRERNETARQAICGVRVDNERKTPVGDKQVDAIVWERREAK
jgi:hypothetical protein